MHREAIVNTCDVTLADRMRRRRSNVWSCIRPIEPCQATCQEMYAFTKRVFSEGARGFPLHQAVLSRTFFVRRARFRYNRHPDVSNRPLVYVGFEVIAGAWRSHARASNMFDTTIHTLMAAEPLKLLSESWTAVTPRTKAMV